MIAQRRLERAALRRYAASLSCRARFLLEELDDLDPTECGERDVCSGEAESAPDAADVDRIEDTLKKAHILILRGIGDPAKGLTGSVGGSSISSAAPCASSVRLDSARTYNTALGARTSMMGSSALRRK